MAREYTVKNNDFSEFDRIKGVYLDRIDKNGTHHYIDTKCPKCGGTGYIPYYSHVQQGTCFLCMGSGERHTKITVRTEEYAKKMQERHLAKIRREAPEKNAKFFEREGLSETGSAWIVLGNTFEIKDELKVAGAKFNGLLGWHFPNKPDQYPAQEITADAILETYPTGLVNFKEYAEVADVIQKMKDDYTASINPETSYVGEIGQKLNMSVIYRKSSSYETNFTYYGETHFIHEFADDNGNVIIWKTGRPLDKEIDGHYEPYKPGEKIQIKGTVKEHEEYRGTKQTVLTRCKIA